MKLTSKIENAYLNSGLKKSDVRRLAKSGVIKGEITPQDEAEVLRILADKDQCAEDALDELRSAAYYAQEIKA
jgi:hypothetical protein